MVPADCVDMALLAGDYVKNMLGCQQSLWLCKHLNTCGKCMSLVDSLRQAREKKDEPTQQPRGE